MPRYSSDEFISVIHLQIILEILIVFSFEYDFAFK